MLTATAGRPSASVTPPDTPAHLEQKKETSNSPNSSSTLAIYDHLARSALDQLATEHNPQQLSALAVDIARGPLEDEKLIGILRSVSREISLLELPGAVPLVTALLNVRWSDLSPRAIETYVRFLSVLASGIPRWWIEIANRVVEDFVLAPESTDPHHRVLGHILQLIPMSESRLSEVLAKHYPHYRSADSQETVNYIKNLLRVAEYAPGQRSSVWQLIVERIVQLDVECADLEENDDDEDDDDEDDDENSDESDTDDDEEFADSDSKRRRITFETNQSSLVDVSREESDDDDSESEDESDLEEVVREGEEVTEAELARNAAPEEASFLPEKLDTILAEVLDSLQDQFQAQRLQSGRASPLFIVLLKIFDEYVLPTHTTRAVQFIMFHVSHQHPQLLESYLVSLIERALSPQEDMDRRLKAMQYISSFVARAKGLSDDQVVSVTTFLKDWVMRYIDERETEVDSAPTMAKFRIFYAAVQALFYIFCFRHHVLRKSSGTDSGSAWVAGLDKAFQRIITTKFNPLKYCKPTVVAMFARIARSEDVAYCFSIMEQNRLGRFRLSASPQSSTTGSSSQNLKRISSVFWPNRSEFAILESYFPFDPLVLKRSHKYVQDHYVEWADVDSDNDSDSFSDSDSDSDSELDSSSSSDSGLSDSDDLKD